MFSAFSTSFATLCLAMASSFLVCFSKGSAYGIWDGDGGFIQIHVKSQVDLPPLRKVKRGAAVFVSVVWLVSIKYQQNIRIRKKRGKRGRPVRYRPCRPYQAPPPATSFRRQFPPPPLMIVHLDLDADAGYDEESVQPKTNIFCGTCSAGWSPEVKI